MTSPCLHGPDCGHPAIRHEDHVGFLQDGDLHCYVRQKGTAKFRVEKHKLDHAGPCCSPTADELDHHTHHDQAEPCNCDGTLTGIDSPLPIGTKVRHGDHYDFLVGDAIHHRKGGVCMEHGKVELLGGEELERSMYMFDVPTGIGSIAVPYSTNKTSLPFWIMLVLSSIFFVVELVGGIVTGSLALESDAFHMASDVIALLIGAVAASMVGRVAESAASTYGYLRGEVVAGLVNGVFLLAVCFIIFIEALQRFSNIDEVKSALKGQENIILIIGSLGLAFNLAGLLGFHAHSHAGHDHSHGGHKHADEVHSPLMHDDVEAQLYTSISDAAPHKHGHDHGHDHAHGSSHAEHSTEHDHSHAHAAAAVHDDAHNHSDTCAHAHQQQHYQRAAAIETHSSTTTATTAAAAGASSNGDGHSHGHKHTANDGHAHAHKHESPKKQFTAAAVTATKAKQSSSKSHNNSHGGHSHGHSHGHDSHGHDANTHGIILHILGDALGSVAVILSALIIKYCTGLGDARYYFDPLASIAITIFLTFHTVPFVRSCIYILLQRAPEWLDVKGLKQEIGCWLVTVMLHAAANNSSLESMLLEGVVGVHELHVWQIDSSRVLCTAHVSVPQGTDVRQVLHRVHTQLHKKGIHASTIQTEIVPVTTTSCSNGSAVNGSALTVQTDAISEATYLCCDTLCADDKCKDKGCCHVE
eukprot:7840-Heterococcus_DN1.PRE.2